ncbi:MAG: AraC family transcriptional regulator [Clostridia bacterium]|nr:AraC family transcriptional regulator [Clostridia bacterium]
MERETFHETVVFGDGIFPATVHRDCRLQKNTAVPALGQAWHEEFEIKYFCEGNAVVEIEDERYQVSEGDILLVNPYESHKTIGGAEGCGYHMIILDSFHLYMDGVGDPLGYCRYLRTGRLKFPHIVRSDAVGETILKLARLRREEPYCDLAKMSLVHYLFFQLFALKEVGVESAGYFDSMKTKSRIEPALKYINGNLHKNLSLDELAEVCCVSKYYFCKLFSETMKISPYKYVCALREKKAEELLKKTDKKMIEIARTIGINDEFYFSKWFKKTHGIAPTEYRARNASDR